jgi:hypothetical protein
VEGFKRGRGAGTMPRALTRRANKHSQPRFFSRNALAQEERQCPCHSTTQIANPFAPRST